MSDEPPTVTPDMAKVLVEQGMKDAAEYRRRMRRMQWCLGENCIEMPGDDGLCVGHRRLVLAALRTRPERAGGGE